MSVERSEIRRTESIKIRLTPAEHARLNAIKGRPELARWIRELALNGGGGKQEVITHVLPPDLVRVMAGIGNNLNQVAKVLNQQAKHSDFDLKKESLSLMLQLQATEQALNELREILKDDRAVF